MREEEKDLKKNANVSDYTAAVYSVCDVGSAFVAAGVRVEELTLARMGLITLKYVICAPCFSSW